MIALEGVLRSHNGGAPIVEGITLYHALCEHNTVVLATSDDRAAAEHWLMVEKLRRHVLVVDSSVAIRDNDIRAGQLRHVAGIGRRIEMLVDPSPSRCAQAMANGITTLLFSQPRYQRPEWRPDADKGMRPWGEITAELEKQAEVEAEDTRV